MLIEGPPGKAVFYYKVGIQQVEFSFLQFITIARISSNTFVVGFSMV